MRHSPGQVQRKSRCWQLNKVLHKRVSFNIAARRASFLVRRLGRSAHVAAPFASSLGLHTVSLPRMLQAVLLRAVRVHFVAKRARSQLRPLGCTVITSFCMVTRRSDSVLLPGVLPVL